MLLDITYSKQGKCLFLINKTDIDWLGKFPWPLKHTVERIKLAHCYTAGTNTSWIWGSTIGQILLSSTLV